MKKWIVLWVSLALLSLMFTGCRSQEMAASPAADKLTKVSVSKSEVFGEVNPDFLAVFEDEPSLETFERLFMKALKREGIADMAEPDYDLEVVYANGDKQEYHLWLSEKGQRSTLASFEDLHVTYTVIEANTDELIDLLQSP